MRRIRSFIFTSLVPFLSQCTSTQTGHYGVQADQLARIPARIAILPCRPWPEGAKAPKQEAVKLPKPELNALCQKFDQFVLQGFDGQSYMRGMSPKLVNKLLEQKKQTGLLGKIDELWSQPKKNCESCDHLASFYRQQIADANAWRSWLLELSRNAAQADAILLPLVAEADQGELNDRGLNFYFRKANLVLLLIDGNTGELMWIGHRKAELRLPKLEARPSDLPSVEDLYQALFTPDLWLEFPGRQFT